jgi:Rab-GTPase-TBC domain
MSLSGIGGSTDGARKAAHLAQLLDADAPLDAAKLRLEASSGVPHAFRPAVWSLLLARTPAPQDPFPTAVNGTMHRNPAAAASAASAAAAAAATAALAVATRSCLSTEAGVFSGGRLANLRGAFDENSDIAQAIRVELRKSAKTVANARAPRTIERYVSIIGGYIASIYGTLENQHSDKEVRDMVHVAAPLFLVFEDNDEAAFSAFSAVMAHIAPFFTTVGLNKAVGDFLMLFKRTLPDVYDVFVDVDFNVQLWAPSALRSLLLRQLPDQCALRLLDSYFSRDSDDIPAFHIHVCVAVLGVMHERDEFNDIEPEALLPRLTNLPSSLPMETILNRATTYQQEREAEGYIPTFHKH